MTAVERRTALVEKRQAIGSEKAAIRASQAAQIAESNNARREKPRRGRLPNMAAMMGAEP